MALRPQRPHRPVAVAAPSALALALLLLFVCPLPVAAQTLAVVSLSALVPPSCDLDAEWNASLLLCVAAPAVTLTFAACAPGFTTNWTAQALNGPAAAACVPDLTVLSTECSFNAAWSAAAGGCVLESLPSATASALPSLSASSSASASPSPSGSLSPSTSPSPTLSWTATTSRSPSPSPTTSPSLTTSLSGTATLSRSSSASMTSTVSPSASVTLSQTASATASKLASMTISSSATPSPTGSNTLTPTLSETPSSSGSGSPTTSRTLSGSVSASASVTVTESGSPTATGSATPTTSPTVTSSGSSSTSASLSATPSSTPTASPTLTGSVSVSLSPSPSATISPTSTTAASAATTFSSTPTTSPSASPSPTLSSSLSPSPTPTASSSGTPSKSASTSPSQSPTVTSTPSSSPSLSLSATVSESPTLSPTVSTSPSASPTVSESVSPSPSPTESSSPTLSPTVTTSPSASPTVSGTSSSSPSLTFSSSPTPSPTISRTVSPLPTVSVTTSSSPTPSTTDTTTPVASSLASRSASPSPTATPTPSGTISTSATLSPTVTSSPSTSATPSSSPSPTLSATTSSAATLSATPSTSPSSSPTSSGAASQSPLASATGAPSGSASPSPTSTGVVSASAVASGSSYPSPTSTALATTTPSPSATLSETPSATGSRSAANSVSPLATGSATTSPVGTAAATPSATASGSSSPAASVSGSSSATPSATSSQSAFPSFPTVSSVPSPSSSGSASSSPTSSASTSGSAAATWSATATATMTATPSPTISYTSSITSTPSTPGQPLVAPSPSNTPTPSSSPSQTPSVSTSVLPPSATPSASVTPSVSFTSSAAPVYVALLAPAPGITMMTTDGSLTFSWQFSGLASDPTTAAWVLSIVSASASPMTQVPNITTEAAPGSVTTTATTGSYMWSFGLSDLSTLQVEAAAAANQAAASSVSVFAVVTLLGSPSVSSTSGVFALSPPAAPAVTISSPAPGAVWILGMAAMNVTIAWSTSNVPANATLNVDLVFINPSGGAEVVAASIAAGIAPSAGSLQWLPAVAPSSCSPSASQAYAVRFELLAAGGGPLSIVRSANVALGLSPQAGSSIAAPLLLAGALSVYATCEPIAVNWNALLASSGPAAPPAVAGSRVATILLQAGGASAGDPSASYALLGGSGGVSAAGGSYIVANGCCAAAGNGSSPLTFAGLTSGMPVPGVQCAGSFYVLASFALQPAQASLCSPQPIFAATAAFQVQPELLPTLTFTSPQPGLGLTPLVPLSIAYSLAGGTGRWRGGPFAPLSAALSAGIEMTIVTLIPSTSSTDPAQVRESIFSGAVTSPVLSTTDGSAVALSASWSPTAAQWAAVGSATNQRTVRVCVPLLASANATAVSVCGSSAPYFYMSSGLIAITAAAAPWVVGEPISLSWTYQATDAGTATFDVALLTPTGAVVGLASGLPASVGTTPGLALGSAQVVVPLGLALASGLLYDLRVSKSGVGLGGPSSDTSASSPQPLSSALLPALFLYTQPDPAHVLVNPAASSTVATVVDIAWSTNISLPSLFNATLCIRPSAALATAFAPAPSTGQACAPVATFPLNLPTGNGGFSFSLPPVSMGLISGAFFVRVSSPADCPSLQADSPLITVTTPTRAITLRSPVAQVTFVAASVLQVQYSTTGILSSTALSVVLSSAAGALVATISAAAENTGFVNWPIPFVQPISGAAWSSSAPLTVTVCDSSYPALAPVCGSTGSFFIAPQTRVLSVTVSPGLLMAGGSVSVSWSISGLQISQASLVSVELMAVRYAFVGGDVSLGLAFANASALAGAVSWVVPSATATTSPVYFKVSVLGQGLWGKSVTSILQPPSASSSAPIGARRLQAQSQVPSVPSLSSWAGLLLRICSTATPSSPIDGPAVPALLCAQDCGTCVSSGGLWAALGTATLSFSNDNGAGGSYLGPTAPLSQSSFAQFAALLGAFSAQGVSACLPQSAAGGLVYSANFSYTFALALQLLSAAAAPPLATVTFTPGLAPFSFSAAGFTSGIGGGLPTCAALLPAVMATVTVSRQAGIAAAAATSSRKVAAAVGTALTVLPQFVTVVGATGGFGGAALAVSIIVQAPPASLQASPPSASALLASTQATLAADVSAAIGGAQVAVSGVLSFSVIAQSDAVHSSAAALTGPASVALALGDAAASRPLTGSSEASLRSSVLTDGNNAWSVTTLSARSASALSASVSASFKDKLQPLGPPAGISIVTIGIAAGAAVVALVCLGCGVRFFRARRLEAAHLRELTAKPKAAAVRSKGAPARFAVSVDNVDVAFNNPLHERPNDDASPVVLGRSRSGRRLQPLASQSSLSGLVAQNKTRFVASPMPMHKVAGLTAAPPPPPMPDSDGDGAFAVSNPMMNAKGGQGGGRRGAFGHHEDAPASSRDEYDGEAAAVSCARPPVFVRARVGFRASSSAELSVSQGELLLSLQREDAEGRLMLCNGASGFAPATNFDVVMRPAALPITARAAVLFEYSPGDDDEDRAAFLAIVEGEELEILSAIDPDSDAGRRTRSSGWALVRRAGTSPLEAGFVPFDYLVDPLADKLAARLRREKHVAASTAVRAADGSLVLMRAVADIFAGNSSELTAAEGDLLLLLRHISGAWTLCCAGATGKVPSASVEEVSEAEVAGGLKVFALASAQFDFTPESGEDQDAFLTLVEGERSLEVLNDIDPETEAGKRSHESGWALVRRNSRELGFVPLSYLQVEALAMLSAQQEAESAQSPAARAAMKRARMAEAAQSAMTQLNSVIDMLRSGGLKSSQLAIFVDATKSNNDNGARSFDGRPLHDVSDPESPNPYQQCIAILGATLAPFDSDGLVPLFGFGDHHTADKAVFSFTEKGKVCAGFDEVLATYTRKIPSVWLAGPTSFAPAIRESIAICKAGGSHELVFCLILADGQVNSRQATEAALVEASKLPIAIICIGVGDGPFGDMRLLDDSVKGRAMDNFTFVEFTKVEATAKKRGVPLDVALATACLSEVPTLVADCTRLGYFTRRKWERHSSVTL